MNKIYKTSFVLLFAATPAWADVPVYDGASYLESAKEYAQEAKSYLLQAQQYAKEVQQYAVMVQEAEGFLHNPSLGYAAGLMGQAGLSNSLPVNPMAVASLTNGFNNLTSLAGILGKLSQLNSLVGTNYATNHIYSPTDGSWNSQQLIANGNAIAGNQGATQSAYEDLRNHLPVLQALRDRLLTASNPKDVADAEAEIQAESAWTSNLQSEIQAIDVNYRAQMDSRVQRDNEAASQSFANFHAMANELAWPQ